MSCCTHQMCWLNSHDHSLVIYLDFCYYIYLNLWHVNLFEIFVGDVLESLNLFIQTISSDPAWLSIVYNSVKDLHEIPYCSAPSWLDKVRAWQYIICMWACHFVVRGPNPKRLRATWPLYIYINTCLLWVTYYMIRSAALRRYELVLCYFILFFKVVLWYFELL